MKYKLFVLTFLLISVSVSSGQTNKDFLKYFRKAETIRLDEKEPISSVLLLDVDKEGQLLVTDKFGVLLYDKKGKLIKKLNSDECAPGIKWLMPRGKFKQSGEIIIGNLPLGGVSHKNNGTCLKKLDNKFYMSPSLSSFKDGSTIILLPIKIFDFGLLTIFNSDGKMISKFGEADPKFKNYQSSGTLFGGLVVDGSNIIYYAPFNSAEIIKYDKSGKQIGKIFRKPDHYRVAREDMPKLDFTKINLNDKKAMEDFQKKIEPYFTDFTFSRNLYNLDENLIMLEYSYRENTYLQIFSLQGKYLLGSDIQLDKRSRLMAAKGGNLYFLVTPDVKDAANVTNPYIEVYKYYGSKN